MRVTIDVPDRKGRPLMRLAFCGGQAVVQSFYPSGQVEAFAVTTVEDVATRLQAEQDRRAALSTRSESER